MYLQWRRLGAWAVKAMIVLMLVLGALAFMPGQTAQAGTGDNYPWKNDKTFPGCKTDSWGYCERYCTSWVAWALHDRNGFEMPRAIGDASQWKLQAQRRGYRVDGNPSRGSVAWFSYDHIAWVLSVNGNSVTIEEYNSPAGTGKWNRRTISKGNASYIHFKDLK